MRRLLIFTLFLALYVTFTTYAYSGQLHDAAFDGDVYKVKGLIEMGTNVNAKDNEGTTALIWASLGGYPEIVKALLSNGADINAKDKNNFTNLMAASLQGHAAVVKILLSNGADTNAKNDEGETALWYASGKGYAYVVRILLLNGADINAKDNEGWTALGIAKKNGNKEIVELLKKANAKFVGTKQIYRLNSKLKNSEIIRDVQELLTNLGYSPGPIDGLIGQKTRKAIIDFQKSMGQPTTGVVSQDLLEKLKNSIRQ